MLCFRRIHLFMLSIGNYIKSKKWSVSFDKVLPFFDMISFMQSHSTSVVFNNYYLLLFSSFASECRVYVWLWFHSYDSTQCMSLHNLSSLFLYSNQPLLKGHTLLICFLLFSVFQVICLTAFCNWFAFWLLAFFDLLATDAIAFWMCLFRCFFFSSFLLEMPHPQMHQLSCSQREKRHLAIAYTIHFYHIF